MNYLALFLIVFVSSNVCAFSSQQLADMTTMNFLWLNKEKPKEVSDGNMYIFPHPYKRRLSNGGYETTDLFERAKRWAELNPKNKIQFWYDGTTVADGAPENTLAKFKTMGISHVELIDINERLKEYESLFDRKLDITYRQDIVRVLACFATFQAQTEKKLFAYFDLSIDPIGLEDLYNKGRTVFFLNDLGWVMGQTEGQGYENSFFVFANFKTTLLIALFKAVIRVNYERIEARKFTPVAKTGTTQEIPNQIVFLDYEQLAYYYYALQELGSIHDNIDKKDLTADQLKTYGEEMRLFDIRKGGLEHRFRFKPSIKLEEMFKNVEKVKFFIPTVPGISKRSKLS